MRLFFPREKGHLSWYPSRWLRIRSARWGGQRCFLLNYGRQAESYFFSSMKLLLDHDWSPDKLLGTCCYRIHQRARSGSWWDLIYQINLLPIWSLSRLTSITSHRTPIHSPCFHRIDSITKRGSVRPDWRLSHPERGVSGLNGNEDVNVKMEMHRGVRIAGPRAGCEQNESYQRRYWWEKIMEKAGKLRENKTSFAFRTPLVLGVDWLWWVENLGDILNGLRL